MYKKIIVFVLLVISVSSLCFAEETQVNIAKINFDKIEPLLLDLAFSNPENQELKEKHKTFKEAENNMMHKALEMHKTGNFDAMEIAGDYTPNKVKEQQTIENLAKGELIVIIEKLYGKKYQLIINDSGVFKNQILYTNLIVSDITANIEQYLLKLKATKTGNEN